MADGGSKNMAMVASAQPSLEYQQIDFPKPGKGQVVVHVSHAAQNPTDVQSFDSAAFGAGAVYGCDFVGKVVQLGEDVSNLKVGDHVAGLIWGGEIQGLGAFSNYTIADARICFKVPDGVSPSSASTIPLALTTAWLAMYSKDCLNIERGKQQSILIWGGSSSVGQYAIQLAALHSLDVVTTCSPRNFELVKKLGAKHVFDYSSSNIVQQIREIVPDLKYVFDTIGNKTSSKQACEAANPNCVMCTVRPGKANTEDVGKSVTVTDVLVWTAFLKDHSYGEFHWPANREDHELSAELFAKVPTWLKEGKIKANEVLLLKGLESVPKGFQMYRDGKISAQKVVYEI